MRETDFRAPPDSRLMAGITPSLHMTPMRLPLCIVSTKAFRKMLSLMIGDGIMKKAPGG